MSARVTHLMGWVVVRAAAPDDLAVVEGLLQPGARVALELPHDLGPGTDDVVLALQSAAGEQGAELVVVAGEQARDRLRAAGVQDVSESLDAAVGDVAPAQHRDRQVSHGAPSTADSVVVTARDMLGDSER